MDKLKVREIWLQFVIYRTSNLQCMWSVFDREYFLRHWHSEMGDSYDTIAVDTVHIEYHMHTA